MSIVAELSLLSMLADLRAAVWTVAATNGLVCAAVLAHALLTRRRRG